MAAIEPPFAGRRWTVAGFTAIEMMVVVSIIILLVAMTVPSIFPAIKKGRVHDAANAIMRACSQARQLARTRQQPPLTAGSAVTCYGVSVVMPSSGQAYAVMTYGSSDPASFGSLSTNELRNPPGTGKYVGKYEFNRNVVPFNASSGGSAGTKPTYTPMNPGSCLGWYYQYRTGFLINNGSAYTTIVNVGTPAVAANNVAVPPQPAIPAGIPPVLGVCSLDQQYIVAVAVYSVGLGNTQDLW